MKTELAKDWLTQGHIDFEYKKYVLLAYLQYVKASYEQQALYPPFSEVIDHYNYLLQLKEGKGAIYKRFPQRLKGVDWERLKGIYQKLIADEDYMKELGEIIEFSLFQFEDKIKEGQSLYEEVEKHLLIERLGLSSLYEQEGFLFIEQEKDPSLYIYRYRLSAITKVGEKFRILHTEFLQKIRQQLGYTINQVRKELRAQYQQLVHPAFYHVVSSQPFPYEETLFPVAKRRFMKFLAQHEQK